MPTLGRKHFLSFVEKYSFNYPRLTRGDAEIRFTRGGLVTCQLSPVRPLYGLWAPRQGSLLAVGAIK
jgi:hypothetical protein